MFHDSSSFSLAFLSFAPSGHGNLPVKCGGSSSTAAGWGAGALDAGGLGPLGASAEAAGAGTSCTSDDAEAATLAVGAAGAASAGAAAGGAGAAQPTTSHDAATIERTTRGVPRLAQKSAFSSAPVRAIPRAMRFGLLTSLALAALACGGSTADSSLSAGPAGGKAGATAKAGSAGATGSDACAELAGCCAAITVATTKKSCVDAHAALAAKPDLTSCAALLVSYTAQGACGGGQGGAGGSGQGGASAGQGGAPFGAGGAPFGAGGGGGAPQGEGGFGMGEGGFFGQGGSAGIGASGKAGAAGVAGGAGGGAGFVPKTCEEAHGVEGCCAPDGKGGWYSQNDLFGVTAFTCKAGEVCSWTPGQMLEGIYDCVVGTTPKVDPKGKFPYLCGLPKIEGTCQ